MFEQKLPSSKNRLEVLPAQVTIVLAEEGKKHLSAILPPLKELREIRTLSAQNFSLKQVSEANHAQLCEALKFELSRLLEKEKKFGSSPTFLTHVADLQEMLGNFEQAQTTLHKAVHIASIPYFHHRIGANYIALGKPDEAQSLFEKLDLSTDVQANLRLAYLSMCTDHFDKATESVERALSISPIDFGARLFRGALAVAKGEFQKAIQNFKFALEERQSVAAYTNLAICYVLIQRPDKAFSALRKAIFLEPYSEHAVGLLADLAFLEKKNEVAVGPLERFIEFDQKSEIGWARLARALLETGQKQKAVAALKRQASVKESSHVFNNLGVVHARLGNRPKALQYFRHAMELEAGRGGISISLPTRNLISVLIDAEMYDAARFAASELIKTDSNLSMASDKVFSDVYAFYVAALTRTGDKKEAIRISKRILRDAPNAEPSLRVWLSAGLLAEMSLYPDRHADALNIGQLALEELSKLDKNRRVRTLLLNNYSFLLLEMGKVTEAGKYLQEISRYVHVDPFVTATFGLLHFRKGDIAKAQTLYEEAMRLAVRSIDRRRIAQKLNFELGCSFLNQDPQKARRYLSMAARDVEPIDPIKNNAGRLLLTLKKK